MQFDLRQYYGRARIDLSADWLTFSLDATSLCPIGVCITVNTNSRTPLVTASQMFTRKRKPRENIRVVLRGCCRRCSRNVFAFRDFFKKIISSCVLNTKMRAATAALKTVVLIALRSYLEISCKLLLGGNRFSKICTPEIPNVMSNYAREIVNRARQSNTQWSV